VDISNDPVAVKKALIKWAASLEGQRAAEIWKQVDDYLKLHGHLPKENNVCPKGCYLEK
jgi:hypothetical protein